MDEKPRRPFAVALFLVALVLSAYFAGLWSGRAKLRQAQDEASRYRLLLESEQAIRRRMPPEVEPPIWDTDKGMQIDALEQMERIRRTINFR